jgi:hypothetical protein
MGYALTGGDEMRKARDGWVAAGALRAGLGRPGGLSAGEAGEVGHVL